MCSLLLCYSFLECYGIAQSSSRLLKMFCIDIVLLQESKTAFSYDCFLRSIGDAFITGWSHLNAIGASRATYSLANIFVCTGGIVGEFYLSVQLTNRRSGQQFVAISVYGRVVELIFVRIMQYSCLGHGTLVERGDFNITRFSWREN